ncbi:hypothetical protein TSAR_001943 [Trichomalopsis sarcophagae]|uniref:Pacifastin domain-containing protein n=1 Tax=Trichomalopsis sarcophagae TaxID=543379 RepID=A0A232FCY0_9HYME|nr:hypothetical protein TSAR_001943 [Trichomalopsis sarcophagae]
MSLKLSYWFLCVVYIFCIYIVTAYEYSDFVGKQCIMERTYNDGCNECFCAHNEKYDNDTWIPAIACTQMECYDEEGKVYVSVDPPEDFWQK